MNRAKRVAIALALLGIPALTTGCGSSQNPNPPINTVPGSQMGGYYGNGTCVPLEQPIPFSIQGAQWTGNPARKILAGARYGGSGTPIVGTALPQTTPYGYGTSLQAQNLYYRVQMNVSNAQQVVQPTTYPYQQPYQQNDYIGMPVSGTLVNITGTLTIDPTVASSIRQMVYSGQIQIPGIAPTYYNGQYPSYGSYPTAPYPTTPYPTTGYTQQPICVSALAFRSTVQIYQPAAYMTDLAIYLNNSQKGYEWTIPTYGM